MNVRLDPSYESFLTNLGQLQNSIQTVQGQISSGSKLSQPSDAPDQVGPLLALQAQAASNTQVLQNLGRVSTEVTGADNAISQAIQLADQASVIATQAANGLSTSNVNPSLAQQVQNIQQQLVSLSATNVGGRYIFSGDQDTQPSYQLNLSSPTGVDRLITPSNTRQILDSSGSPIPASQTAQDLFDHRDSSGNPATDNLFAAVNGLRVALLNNDANGISTAIGTLAAATNYVNSQQGFYGAAETRLASATANSQTLSTSLQAQISSISDTDLAQAAIQLSQLTTQEQAALTARAKVPLTSLFSYLGSTPTG